MEGFFKGGGGSGGKWGGEEGENVKGRGERGKGEGMPIFSYSNLASQPTYSVLFLLQTAYLLISPFINPTF